MEPQEKIKVPAAWSAACDADAQRRQSVEEWKGYLSGQPRKTLETEGVGAVLKTAIPLDKLRAFNPDEQDELMAHEQAEYERLRPLAVARDEQRRAFVAAGGDGESFDGMWEHGG